MQLSVPVSFSLCCASSFSCASSQVLAMSSVTMPSRERWGQRLTIMIQTRFFTVSISTNLFQTKLRHILIKEITNLGRPSFHGVSLGHPHPQDSELKINKIFKIKNHHPKEINAKLQTFNEEKLLCMKCNSHEYFICNYHLSTQQSVSSKRKVLLALTSISFLMLTEENSTLGVWRPPSPELLRLNWLLFSSSLYP